MELEAFLDCLRVFRAGDLTVEAWSVYATESCRLSLGIKDRVSGGPHAPLSLSESCGSRYLLVWSDGLVSRGYLERRQFEGDPLAALNHARSAAYEDTDAAQVAVPAAMPEVELFDAATADAARGATSALAQRLEMAREQLETPRFRTWSGSFSAAVASSRLVTSAGLDVDGEGTSTGWHVTLNGEVGDGFGARRPETDAEYGDRLRRLTELALRLDESPAVGKAGVQPVILHPRVVREYVLDTLLQHLDGSTVDHGEGRFSRDQFVAGERFAREDLFLRVDPLRPFRSGAYRFSAEGLPAGRCTFVENGRLVTPLLNLKFARRLDLPPTPMPYAADVLEFGGPPPLALDDAIREAGEGALVLSVLGVHTQDIASGDFSLSAPQALGLSDGGYAGRLRATISGNLFELLASPSLRFVTFEGEPTPGLLFPCRLDPK